MMNNVSLLQFACDKMDFAVALQRLRMHKLTEQACRYGMAATVHDKGLLYMGHQAAHRATQLGLYEKAYVCLRALEKLLSVGDYRRKVWKEQVRPNTETRLDIINTLSCCLAHDPRGAQPAKPWTPVSVASQYELLVRRWLDRLEETRQMRDDHKHALAREKAAHTGLAVIKMATRYQLTNRLALIRDFNNAHGETLLVEPRQYKFSWGSIHRDALHLDYEFYKLSLDPTATIRELRECQELRLQAVHHSPVRSNELLLYCYEQEFAAALESLRHGFKQVSFN
ncbi:hypothetical protein JW859_05470 [bacterium]|nr:hypothetical protein [bacterium]